MVEVGLSNFELVFPAVVKAIRNASFIALDNEFTGLVTEPMNKPSLFDSADDRYLKLRETATKFTICQLGLSIFTRSKDANVYTVQTYVFYLRPYSCGSIDRRFLCQASAVDFLCRYNFDFNKFAKEGIPYLNEIEEKQLEKELASETIFIHHERTFGQSLRYQENLLLSSWLLTAREGDKLALEKYIGGHEYFQLNEIRRKYPTVWASVENNEVVVEKISNIRRQELEKTVAEEEKRVLKFYIGFSAVFKIIKEAKKPIIGHNLLTDILLIYASFYKPLPKSYKEFKQEVNTIFPVIYDTKHIWLNLRRFYAIDGLSGMSSLMELFTIFKSPPENLVTFFSPVIMLSNCPLYGTEAFPHNAGFDAYATGFVFTKLCHFLAMLSNKNKHLQPPSLREHLVAVKPFENKVNIMWAKLLYIDLHGPDPTPHRPECLHVKAKKKDGILSKAEITNRLLRFGGIEVKMISKQEALVATSRSDGAKQIIKAFRNHEDFVVSRYSSIRHSTPLRLTLWLSSLVSGSVAVYLLFQLAKSHR